MEQTELNVNLGSRAYPIHFGRGLLEHLADYVNLDRKVLVLTDDGVPKEYLDTVLAQCPNGSAEVVPMGEGAKSFPVFERVCARMLELNFGRRDLLIALGGGVVGDLGGFAAAGYMRGIDFIQIPTTTLSQIDSSVGGKTAINLNGVKNIIGAFHQPRLVLADPKTLSTLPDAYFTDGMGEVIKYGCIADAALFDKLEQGQVIDHLEETICRCVLCKKHFVEEDTNDKGQRMILNFGHTFGHALEKLTGFSSLSHGLAVGIGMVMAGEVGESLGVTEKGTAARIRRVLESYGMPTESAFDFAKVVEATALDKKSFGKTLNLILLKQIGESVIHPVDRNYLVLRYKLAAEQNRRRKLN